VVGGGKERGFPILDPDLGTPITVKKNFDWVAL
jgi:hypothetical protein